MQVLFYGAASQNRTDDLILTKDVLYRLSHSSKPNVLYYSKELSVCQALFRIFLIFSVFYFCPAVHDISRRQPGAAAERKHMSAAIIAACCQSLPDIAYFATAKHSRRRLGSQKVGRVV